METTGNQLETTGTREYKCDTCDKTYANRGGLWKHKQKCKTTIRDEDIFQNAPTAKDREIELLTEQKDREIELLREQIEILKQQNDFLQQQLVAKTAYETTTNIALSNKKTIRKKEVFYINIYLNETCRDAIPMETFVKEGFGLPTLSDYTEIFYHTGRGNKQIFYNEQLAKLVNREIQNIPQNNKPIQTTDASRNEFYFKTNDEWFKYADNPKRFHSFLDRLQCCLSYDFNIKKKEIDCENNDELAIKMDSIQSVLLQDILPEKILNTLLKKL
jgi:ribosomal protein L37AE/L43A